MFLNKIKIFLVISITLIFTFLSYDNVNSEEFKIILGTAKVIDGDTIKINKEKIRLMGIDAPEKKQKCEKIWLSIHFLSFKKQYPCGEISTNKLKKKINNKHIVCKWTNKDRYNRLIAECFKDKMNINDWMIRNGLAVAYRKYSKKYVAQENFARREKLGLWSGTFEMPWDWRKKN